MDDFFSKLEIKNKADIESLHKIYVFNKRILDKYEGIKELEVNDF